MKAALAFRTLDIASDATFPACIFATQLDRSARDRDRFVSLALLNLDLFKARECPQFARNNAGAVFIGGLWQTGQPRYPAEILAAYVRPVINPGTAASMVTAETHAIEVATSQKLSFKLLSPARGPAILAHAAPQSGHRPENVAGIAKRGAALGGSTRFVKYRAGRGGELLPKGP